MKQKVKIRFLEDSSYAIKTFYRNHIDIYDIDYTLKDPIYTIKESDLEKLENYEIEIISYRGLKSCILNLKRESHFLMAFILACFIIFFLSNICFSVNVVHSNKDIRVLVEDELYDLGIRPLTFKKSFKKLQSIKNKIKDTYPNDIEWLEIIDDGMKYTVRVEERIITKPEPPKDYCDIVATKDGVVLNIISTKGQTVIDNQDFVKAGSVLISGKIKFNEVTKSHVCAEGKVYGNTWYKASVSIPMKHTIKNYTGKKKKNIAFEIGTNYSRIFKIHYKEYDIKKKRIFKLGNFSLYLENVEEYTSTTREYTKEEALKEALKQGREKLKLKLDDSASILNEKVLQSEDYNSIISVDIFYSVKEIISKRVESEYKEEIKELE